jgi:hypothetical protein
MQHRQNPLDFTWSVFLYCIFYYIYFTNPCLSLDKRPFNVRILVATFTKFNFLMAITLAEIFFNWFFFWNRKILISIYMLVRLFDTRHCVILRSMFEIRCLEQYLNQRQVHSFMSSDQSQAVPLLLLLASRCEDLIEKTRSERKNASTFKQSYVFQIPSLHNPVFRYYIHTIRISSDNKSNTDTCVI